MVVGSVHDARGTASVITGSYHLRNRGSRRWLQFRGSRTVLLKYILCFIIYIGSLPSSFPLLYHWRHMYRFRRTALIMFMSGLLALVYFLVTNPSQQRLASHSATNPNQHFLAAHYSNHLARFTSVSGSSVEARHLCATLKASFVDEALTNHKSGYVYDNNFLTLYESFNSPSDPLNVRHDTTLQCEAVNGYRRYDVNDGQLDPGYGVEYYVSVPLSVPAYIDFEDMSTHNRVSLYTRFNASPYTRHAPGTSCSVQNGSTLVYLRSVTLMGSYVGTVVRYIRPSTPVVSNDQSRYANLSQCRTNSLISFDNFDFLQDYGTGGTVKLTLVKK